MKTSQMNPFLYQKYSHYAELHKAQLFVLFMNAILPPHCLPKDRNSVINSMKIDCLLLPINNEYCCCVYLLIECRWNQCSLLPFSMDTQISLTPQVPSCLNWVCDCSQSRNQKLCSRLESNFCYKSSIYYRRLFFAPVCKDLSISWEIASNFLQVYIFNKLCLC